MKNENDRRTDRQTHTWAYTETDDAMHAPNVLIQPMLAWSWYRFDWMKE